MERRSRKGTIHRKTIKKRRVRSVMKPTKSNALQPSIKQMKKIASQIFNKPILVADIKMKEEDSFTSSGFVTEEEGVYNTSPEPSIEEIPRDGRLSRGSVKLEPELERKSSLGRTSDLEKRSNLERKSDLEKRSNLERKSDLEKRSNLERNLDHGTPPVLDRYSEHQRRSSLGRIADIARRQSGESLNRVSTSDKWTVRTPSLRPQSREGQRKSSVQLQEAEVDTKSLLPKASVSVGRDNLSVGGNESAPQRAEPKVVALLNVVYDFWMTRIYNVWILPWLPSNLFQH